MDRLRYLWSLYQKAFGAYTWKIIIVVVLAFFSSLAAGIGISTIIPLFSFVTGSAANAPTDTISRTIEGLFALIHVTYSFRMLLVFMAALFVLRVIVIAGIQIITARIVYDYQRDLQRKLFSETLSASWPYLSTQRIGNLEQLVTTNASNAAQFFGNFSTIAMVCTNVLIYILVAVNISWWIAAFSLVVGIVMLFVLRPIFFRGRAVAVATERTNRDIAHFVSEHIIGMKAVKAMSLERPVIARGWEFFDKMRNLSIRSIALRSFVQVLIQLAAVVFVGVVFLVMYRSPSFSIAAFLVIVYAISQIFSQIQAGQMQAHGVMALLPYIAESIAYSDRTTKNIESLGGGHKFTLDKEITFRDVSFSYPGRESILQHVHFTIRKGELLGIVGPSGSGKTTVADLLLRLVQPSEGVIYVDDRDIREISVAAWRTHVGYVAQDAVLLNDTIEQNIRFYNTEISNEDVVHAAKLANIHGFIETLPEKYGTQIGDRGIMLSGGQRQRIALARVLARKPALLVLDEATSSLDMESERAIQSAVEGLRGDITIVIIAHRLSTIANADRVIEIKDGAAHEADRSKLMGSDHV